MVSYFKFQRGIEVGGVELDGLTFRFNRKFRLNHDASVGVVYQRRIDQGITIAGVRAGLR